MNQPENVASVADALRDRRVRCIITYLHPFRLINSDTSSSWSCNIDQVNNRTWDYVALHEMVGGVNVGLIPPYHLAVGRDGALALPPIPELRSIQSCVEFFNRCLAGLLLGGIYCEAVTSDGLDTGSIIDWKYIRSHGNGQALPNSFHNQLRQRKAGPLDSINLYNPTSVSFSEIEIAMGVGLAFLSRLTTVRGEYLLKGVTAIARRDWGNALANLWIVTEQILAQLWEDHIIKPTLEIDPSKSRRSQLSDGRTWTSSARIEMLFQKSVISDEITRFLGVARKSRNDLAHRGEHPSENEASMALSGVLALLVVALNGERPPLLDMNLADHSLSDPFGRPRAIPGKPEFWMKIPKLPGEDELERQEAAERSQSRQQEI